jgi:GNAT superfamily N-acetyltransferase
MSYPIVPVAVTKETLILSQGFRCGDLPYQQDLARWLVEDAPKALKDKTRIWYYVTNDDSRQIAGFGSLGKTKWQLEPEGDKVRVQIIPALAVHSDHQGKRYSGIILKHLIGEATDLFHKVSPLLGLFVHPENELAIRTYRNAGFKMSEHIRCVDQGVEYLGMTYEL